MLPVLVMSMVAHEYAHGYAALRQGDNTAKMLGRLTFNPLKHIDPWLTILLPAMLWFGSGGRFLFGGAKPVPVNPRNYRNYRRGDIIVSMAGIATNLALFLVFCGLAVVVGILGHSGPAGLGLLVPLQRVLFWGIWFNLLLANFNLIPIPPLDGSHVFYHLLPPELGLKYRQLSRYGFLILLALIYFMPGALSIMLLPAIGMLRLALSLMSPFILVPFGVV
ncbi:MAG: site-2 protease family protein [Gemmatimonadetes bacterium]|nr:site-2 protease family protein [Gemmatimonadota bacterium]